MLLRNLLVFIVALFVPICGMAQQTTKWDQFIDHHQEISKSSQSAFYVLSLDTPTKSSQLFKQGFRVIRKLDDRHFIVKNTHQTSALGTLFPANNDWKLPLGFYKKFTTDHDQLLVRVNQVEAFKQEIVNSGIPFRIERQFPYGNTLLIALKASEDVTKLLALESVLFVDLHQSTAPVVESRVLGMDLTVNQVTTLKHHQPNLTGDGILISINEQQFETDDIDLINKAVPSGFENEETSSHATDMATTAAGLGNSSRNGLGVATAAQLSSTDNLYRTPDEATYYSSSGIYVQNHSWGEASVQNSMYGTIAEAYDLSANENAELLHVFSIGNSGNSTGEEGTYAGLSGFANMTGEYKMAKNMLVVSAVEWNLDPIGFVSSGPAYDGRVKPELCAFNVNGSSGATATVSGIVALLQQAYKNQHADALPASALIKALLINSADDAGAEGLDFNTGYGNVNAWKAYQSLAAEDYFSGAIGNGQEQQFNLDVPANAKNLKITLVWNDPAASPNANTALVNDLDFVLTTPSSGDLLPWGLNTDADVSLLAAAATRKADHLNNIEQITLDDPEAGTYQLSVTGFDIPAGTQDYYMVYEWETADSFEWLHPTGSDNMPYLGEGTAASEDASYFRWNSTYDAGTLGLLEYTIDDGGTWTTIASNVDLSTGFLYWEAPDTFALAKARMTISSTPYVSDEFTLTRVFNVDVGFNCADSLQFNWPFRENAAKYVLYQMGSDGLETLLETTDTFTVLELETLTTQQFAVEPVFANSTFGVRSATFDYTLQGAGCYLNSFFVLLTETQDSVELNIDLGTFYGVSDIVFERAAGIDGTDFLTIETVSQFESNPVVHFDVPEVAGIYEYRARIIFDNGGEVITETTRIYFLGDELPILIFPNPVSKMEGLSVFTKIGAANDAKIQLYNLQGRLIMQNDLFSDRQTFSVEEIDAGMYIYRITIDEQVQTGRIVVQ